MVWSDEMKQRRKKLKTRRTKEIKHFDAQVQQFHLFSPDDIFSQLYLINAIIHRDELQNENIKDIVKCKGGEGPHDLDELD